VTIQQSDLNVASAVAGYQDVDGRRRDDSSTTFNVQWSSNHGRQYNNRKDVDEQERRMGARGAKVEEGNVVAILDARGGQGAAGPKNGPRATELRTAHASSCQGTATRNQM
jgi:hypothetical protein